VGVGESSEACVAESNPSSAFANGMRVEPDGDTPDLGSVEVDDGDVIRSILSCVGVSFDGGLGDALVGGVSFAGGSGLF
jgi:hypothetical protein